MKKGLSCGTEEIRSLTLEVKKCYNNMKIPQTTNFQTEYGTGERDVKNFIKPNANAISRFILEYEFSQSGLLEFFKSYEYISDEESCNQEDCWMDVDYFYKFRTSDCEEAGNFITAVFRRHGYCAHSVVGRMKDSDSRHLWTEYFDPQETKWKFIEPTNKNNLVFWEGEFFIEYIFNEEKLEFNKNPNKILRYSGNSNSILIEEKKEMYPNLCTNVTKVFLFTDNERINLNIKNIKTYSTLELIDDLKIAVGRLIGKISYRKLSIYLGRNKEYISDVRYRINNPNQKKYNPNFKFSIEDLSDFRDNLIRNLGEYSSESLKLIQRYKVLNSDLKRYKNQQYHKHHPNLIEDFFKRIDTKDKAYWYGFLCADGNLNGIQIRLELSRKDISVLIRFCETIGLDPDLKVKERDRFDERTKKTYYMAYVQFTCKPMAEDLRKQGYASSKTLRKNIPKFRNQEIFLAWLLGFYDGDGGQNTTLIYSASKDYLEQIRNRLGLKWDVVLKSGEAENPYYYLRIGAKIFNEMMKNYNNSLERKRRLFSEFQDAYIDLTVRVGSKKNLQKLIDQYPKSILAKKLNVNYRTLQKLINEWNISDPRKKDI